MYKLNQKKTPYLTALKKYLSEGISPFDVPGHHMGNTPNKLKDFLGKRVFEADINAPIGLDNLANPTGVIKDTCDLMADATGADHAFLLINGTSSGIIASILASVNADEKIILPRNVHKSILSALVLSGAVPLFVNPQIDSQLEIANQPSFDDYKKAIIRYPSAKAVFVINPTYFGAIADLEKIVDFAHQHNMIVIVDEAHGAHYYFSSTGPKSAMECGADITSVSMHKTGGSLTQSSVLLIKEERVKITSIQKALNILNTTSPSTLLLASLDTARHYMANYGEAALEKTVQLAKYAFDRIGKIPGFVPRGKKYFLQRGCYDYDKTKLVIELDKLDLTGHEVYQLLKTKYHIQLELAEAYTLLGIIAIGTKKKHIDNLIVALKDISKTHYHKNWKYPNRNYNITFPFAMVKPRTAYHAPSIKVHFTEALGMISKESIMIYPPGIPLIIPGEVFTKEVIERLTTYRKTGVTILSDYKDGYVNVIDSEKWKQNAIYRRKIDDFISKRKTTPRIDGYQMPFEGDKHYATLMLLPFRKDTWRLGAKPAQEAFKQVITAISEFEKVIVGVHPSIYDSVVADYESLENVSLIKIKYNDAWARDNMPIFVTKEHNSIRAVDFRFNAWGGSFDGLYNDYQDDDSLAKKIATKLKVDSYYLDNFVLEGGSIHVDGQGTLMTTEACLLSDGRNPHFSKQEIEERLKTYFNVDKVIWLKHGIDGDETNEHIDNMACFVRPGVVALAWTDDKTTKQYHYCRDAYNVLKKEKDAQGNRLSIVKVPLPAPLYMTKEEARGIKKTQKNAKPRQENDFLAGSYVNYYQGHDFIILPRFGVKEDKKALSLFKKLYPDKKVVQVDSREILLGGGNIHCITMQIPALKEEENDR